MTSIPPNAPLDDVFTFSASGISTARGCMRKASYRYVLGVVTESNASAALGTKIHKEMEDWFLIKRVPELAPTKRLLPLAPNPTHEDIRVEHPFRILLPVGAARGFVDLLVPKPDLARMPGGGWSHDRPAVFDWKSTSNLAYAKSETDLLKDPQAILYGVAARLAVASKVSAVPEVDLQWTYTTTRGADSRAVKIRQTLPILEDGLGEVIDTAEKMKAAFGAAAVVNAVDDVPYDLRECDKYGGCPHRETCSAHRIYVSTGTGPALDGESTAPTVSPPTERTTPVADSALLARLRAGAKTPPKPAPLTESAPSITEAPSAVNPSPEPVLPVPDTAGLDEPLPAGSSPINSPEAAENVSPSLPPPASAAVVAVPATKPKARRGSMRAPALEVVGGVGDLDTTLNYYAQKALSENDPKLARALTEALIVLGGH